MFAFNFQKMCRMVVGHKGRRRHPRNTDSNNKYYLKTKISIPTDFNKIGNIINLRMALSKPMQHRKIDGIRRPTHIN